MPEQLRAAGVTARELDTFWLVADRLQNRAIADRLSVSERTVESHISSLLRKLGGTNRISLVAMADDLRDQLERRDASLPMPLSSFVGRTDQLDDLAELVTAHRLVTLTGPAGAGKTRLALQLARTTDALPPATLVDLAALPPGGPVERAFTDALGIDIEGRPARTILRDALSEGRHWLVVDNCEHVADAVAALLSALLSSTRQLTVLATSHGPLRVAGEVVYEVPPLGLPPESATDQDAEAVRLFADRAAAAAPGFAVTQENARDVAAVCRRLDGLPLAIELAAARIRTFSPAELLARLDDRFAFLTDGARGTETRHRTLEEALRWSYDLLDDDERLVLERCSVFPGSFDYDTVAGVVSYAPSTSADFDRAFPRLLDRSLVVSRRRGQTTEYRLLDSVRHFAHRQLVEREGGEAVRDQHARYVFARAVGLGDAVRGSDQPMALAWFDRRWGDLVAAMSWAFESEQYELAWTFVAGVGTAWDVVGVHGVLFDWLDQLLERPWPAGELGQAAAVTAAIALCQQSSARSIEIAELADLATSRASTLLARGWAGGRGPKAGEAEARRQLREAADLFGAAGDPWHRAFALTGLAAVETNADAALACCTESAELFRQCGDLVKRANVLYHMAMRAIEWNVRLDEVGGWIAEASELAERAGTRHEILHVAIVAATFDQACGEYDLAEARFRELLSEFRRLDDRRCVSRCLRGLGLAATRSGDLDTARRHLVEAVRLAAETGPRQRVVDALELLANVETTAGRPDRAELMLKVGAADDPVAELDLLFSAQGRVS